MRRQSERDLESEIMQARMCKLWTFRMCAALCCVETLSTVYMDRIKLYLCFVHFCFSAHRFMWLLHIRNYNIAIIIININYMGKNVKMICDPNVFGHTTNNTLAYVFRTACTLTLCMVDVIFMQESGGQTTAHSISTLHTTLAATISLNYIYFCMHIECVCESACA